MVSGAESGPLQGSAVTGRVLAAMSFGQANDQNKAIAVAPGSRAEPLKQLAMPRFAAPGGADPRRRSGQTAAVQAVSGKGRKHAVRWMVSFAVER